MSDYELNENFFEHENKVKLQFNEVQSYKNEKF
jgi:hypothetical protein